MYKAIGETLTFNTPTGETLTGKIVGRDWGFSTLLAYTVKVGRLHYHVNPDTLQSGHSF